MIARYLTLLVTIALLGSGCAPRGETRNLDEILNSSREKFQTELVRAPLASETKQSLSQLQATLDKLSGQASPGELKAGADEAAKIIDVLIPKAGYTSRPALDELSRQLAHIQVDSNSRGNAARAKLLASRAYFAVASELQGMRFAL